MGLQAWVPSPCPLPRPCPFLLLLLLLLVVVPLGAQPQVGRVSTDPLPHNVAEGSLWPLRVPGKSLERGKSPTEGVRSGLGALWGDLVGVKLSFTQRRGAGLG